MSPSAGQDRSAALYYLTFALSLRKVECGVAAAAGGAAYILKGLAGGGERIRDEERETLVMFMMGSMAAGVMILGLIVVAVKAIKRYVFKIKPPPKSFVLDKKVKCTSGKTQFFYFNNFILLILNGSLAYICIMHAFPHKKGGFVWLIMRGIKSKSGKKQTPIKNILPTNFTRRSFKPVPCWP